MKLSSSFDDILVKSTRFLWGAALFTLPVTSFRYFPLLGDSTYVRPLSLYPIGLLLPILLIQWMRGKISLPRAGALIPLIGFVLVVLAGTSLGSILDPFPLRGQGYFGRVIRAWATLVIGISFFISAVWMNRNEDDLRFTVKWLLAGFVMDVLVERCTVAGVLHAFAQEGNGDTLAAPFLDA